MTEQEHGSVAMGDSREEALMKAVKEFCLRVETGEIRSKRSYTAFRAALSLPPSRPVQEPVCTVSVIGAGGHRWLTPHPLNALDAMPIGTPLYAAPQPAHGTSATERVPDAPAPISRGSDE